MEKLPPTSYVRMVDIWLIFGQLIPFIEVALLTYIEFVNQPETVNHHGQPRKVMVRLWYSSSFQIFFLFQKKEGPRVFLQGPKDANWKRKLHIAKTFGRNLFKKMIDKSI